ncbi:MAG: HAD family phosphatase [Treponema sp.]|jgi:HAD superfamily hydrolase (TIGR01509 family)|nr:HAD family phosphatase [Treponema sp.]
MKETAKFRPAAAIFDMDGLMLETEKPLIPLWKKVGSSFGFNITEAMIFRTIGVDDKTTRGLYLREFGPDFPYDQIRGEMSRLTREEFEKGIAHRPGLTVLLDHLSALKIPMVVATSTRRESAVWKLEKAGILKYFTALACGDEIANGKPAPDIFLLAAERLGYLPSVCVGFEDSPAGLQGLHAAGIRPVFVKDLIEPPQEILATVWRRYGDLAEAAELFG